MTSAVAPFTYGPRSAADQARIRQQNGEQPAPHVLKPSDAHPHMCSVCFATRQAAVPWHLNDSWNFDDVCS